LFNYICIEKLEILLKIDDCKLNLYVSLIMTLICLDPCQWSLMSLITGNKVKKHTSQGIVKKKRTKLIKDHWHGSRHISVIINETYKFNLQSSLIKFIILINRSIQI
jgi:hypothetical protein